jgi:hypothetical protein
VKTLILICSLLFIFFVSCEFKHEEDLFANDCDTLNVTYKTIEPILQANCVRCHNDQVFNREIKLNTYEHAKAAAETGLLKMAVNHESGVTPMPYLLNKLDTCSVRKITIWIETDTPK